MNAMAGILFTSEPILFTCNFRSSVGLRLFLIAVLGLGFVYACYTNYAFLTPTLRRACAGAIVLIPTCYYF